MADSPLPMRAFFQDVNLTHANGVTAFTKGRQRAVYETAASTRVGSFPGFMRHATTRCLTGSSRALCSRLKAADDARKTAYLYALNSASGHPGGRPMCLTLPRKRTCGTAATQQPAGQQKNLTVLARRIS
jgi:hypothetical protein